MNSVLVSFIAKQAISNAFDGRATSLATQVIIPLLRRGIRPHTTRNLYTSAYSNEPAACAHKSAAFSNKLGAFFNKLEAFLNKPEAFSNKQGAFSNASAAISCFTPAPADRLHYTHRLPGGGLDTYEA